MSKYFPDLSTADDDGFLCWSPDINGALLQDAYENGIFPWPQRETEILWFSPPERGIIFFEDLHISKSFKKFLKQQAPYFEFRLDHDFETIIQKCADTPRPDQLGSWITPDLMKCYMEEFNNQNIHCVGVYERTKLVAGVYGVYHGNYFSAESMFFEKPNTSKMALLLLIRVLQSMGHSWIDVQTITPVSKQFGGRLVDRSNFLAMIDQSGQKKIPWKAPRDLHALLLNK
jgi:leucyl/phenylalanyl-tRNA--protein transferase